MLTAQQIKDFKRDGFVLVKGLYDKDEMQKITTWTDELSNYSEQA